MESYFLKIKKLISEKYVKNATDDQLYRLAAYGLVESLDNYSSLLFSEKNCNNIKYNKPLFDITSPNILYVHLFDFYDQSLQDFENFIQTLNINSLHCILDLRRNAGGKLDCAIKLLKYFVPQKKIIELKYREHIETYYTEFCENTFISTMVIIDNTTASASEVVAGSIQYYKKGLIIGEISCGKSSVQSIIEIEDNIFLKLTVGYFYINGEYDINRKGLNPDIYYKEFNDIVLVKNMKNCVHGQFDFRIAIIQQCMRHLKFYDYDCNGIYDDNTLNSINKFNEYNNINSDTPLSQKTLNEMKKSYFQFCYDGLNAAIIGEAKRILLENIDE